MMEYKVKNAIIMAAGLSSRFAPLSYEIPKALIKVKGEVLIERQIKQLKEAGIDEIFIVVGYQKDKFRYLINQFGVTLIENSEYLTRNNIYSLYLAKEHLHNSYICSADNYFEKNPFERYVDESYYAAIYNKGNTSEWCLATDAQDYIIGVEIGGADSWVMLGHVFFSEVFSDGFKILLEEAVKDEALNMCLWEHIFQQNLNKLSMKIRKYEESDIFEFDSLDELRLFDESYKKQSGSIIMKDIANQLCCDESKIVQIEPMKNTEGSVCGILFSFDQRLYQYNYLEKRVKYYG